jgi:hypothetical protein
MDCIKYTVYVGGVFYHSTQLLDSPVRGVIPEKLHFRSYFNLWRLLASIFLLTWTHNPDLKQTSFCNCSWMLQATTNFLVFDLTRQGLKSMTYHTLDEHGNHYTTNTGFKSDEDMQI